MRTESVSITHGQERQILSMFKARLKSLGLTKKQAQSIIVSGQVFCPAVQTMFRQLLALPEVVTSTDKKIRPVLIRLSECSDRW